MPRLMSDWLDAIDHKPGRPPDLRKVGTSLLVVMSIRDVAPAYPNVRLVLRLESNGDLFAAIAGGSAEPSGT
jgi:hypothetical protein